MSKIYKKGDAKKASFKRLPELSEMNGNLFNFCFPIKCLLVSLLGGTQIL